VLSIPQARRSTASPAAQPASTTMAAQPSAYKVLQDFNALQAEVDAHIISEQAIHCGHWRRRVSSLQPHALYLEPMAEQDPDIQKLGHWTPPRRRWTCHRATGFAAKFPRRRQQDREVYNRAGIQQVHEGAKGHWDCAHQPTCTSKFSGNDRKIHERLLSMVQGAGFHPSQD
jgi:hypothetical protein